jgi:predicted DNA-binding transcriptional regulator AlpA
VVDTCSFGEPKLVERGENIRRRVDRTLAIFPSLPDAALIDVRVVSALVGRSTASVWRDVSQGRLSPPVHVGARSTRWRVGDVRAALNGGRRNVA